MAKRRPIRDHRKQKRRPAGAAAGLSPEDSHAGSKTWQAVTISHPVKASTLEKRCVEKSRNKHNSRTQADQLSYVRPTLSDRFHALPTELRAHIFSILVVRPVKWQAEHVELPDDERISHQDPGQSISACDYYCATDSGLREWRKDRHEGKEIGQHPWRSEWAPPQLNPFVCTFCYDQHLRAEPFPKPVSLPCLCARRQNLETLLVCKRWYEEAATVFYTQNTFAFEELSTFVEWAKNLNPRWRRVISKLSIMTISAALPTPSEDSSENHTSKKWLSGTWNQLNNFPSLSYLELDLAFLTRTKAVRALLRLRLLNLRQLRFSFHLEEHNMFDASGPPPPVWPRFAKRRLVRGGFAEEVARAVKGQRQSALLGPDSHRAIKAGIEQINEQQEELMALAS